MIVKHTPHILRQQLGYIILINHLNYSKDNNTRDILTAKNTHKHLKRI